MSESPFLTSADYRKRRSKTASRPKVTRYRRLYRLGLRILTVVFVILPIALWVWQALSVTLICTLDESGAACSDPSVGLADIGFLRLAIIPWALAVLCNFGLRRLNATP